MTEYYAETLKKLKKRYGNNRQGKRSRLIFILGMMICLIPVITCVILLANSIINEKHASRGLYAEYAGNARKELCGISFNMPDGWARIGEYYYAEVGDAVSMIYFEECGDDELKDVMLEDGLKEDDAEKIISVIISGMQQSMKNYVTGEIVHTIETNYEIYSTNISFDFISSNKGIFASEGEIDLLYNIKNRKVVTFIFLQTENVMRDHTDEYLDMIESISVE